MSVRIGKKTYKRKYTQKRLCGKPPKRNEN